MLQQNAFVVNHYTKTPVTKISTPINIKITPPNISALPPNLSPNLLPKYTAPTHMPKVTAAIIPTHSNACKKLLPAMSLRVKPVDKASIDVATACANSAITVNGFAAMLTDASSCCV